MDFITEANIRRFKEMLAREVDPVRRATIKKLLQEEQWKGRSPDPAHCRAQGGLIRFASSRSRS